MDEKRINFTVRNRHPRITLKLKSRARQLDDVIASIGITRLTCDEYALWCAWTPVIVELVDEAHLKLRHILLILGFDGFIVRQSSNPIDRTTAIFYIKNGTHYLGKQATVDPADALTLEEILDCLSEEVSSTLFFLNVRRLAYSVLLGSLFVGLVATYFFGIYALFLFVPMVGACIALRMVGWGVRDRDEERRYVRLVPLIKRLRGENSLP